ncbi:hypothetical protein ACPW96_00165 [Micromonospora sp. DT81.3]|uniref:hypothetical protein n=1 Tax=Actinomycetes TaxID=1760 RepID=UPI003CF7B65C
MHEVVPLTVVWVESRTNSAAADAQLHGTFARPENPSFEPRVVSRWQDVPAWVLLPGRDGPFVAYSLLVELFAVTTKRWRGGVR